MTSPKKHEIVWLEKGPLPTLVGFCPSKKAWKKYMKGMGLQDEEYPETKGMCVSLKHKATQNYICLVTLQDNAENLTDDETIFLVLLHEAVHVWQTMVEDINEQEPSREFEAYMIEFITKGLIKAYKQTRLTYKYDS